MNESADKKRGASGAITAFIGLVLNLILGGVKLFAGIISGSVAVTADAANSLSDCFSSGVTIASFKISDKKASKKHPYGFGRVEYIASFIIGIVIVFIAFEFLVTSIEKIITPADTKGSVLVIAILASSILVKVFMAVFYKINAKKLNSDALNAAAFDSLSDTLTTLVSLVSVIIAMTTNLKIVDGILGIAVSLFVFYGGIKILISTISKLLGGGANVELEEKLDKFVCSFPKISGTHDLNLHDYGPNKRIASLHAEFDENLSITEAHQIIDDAERAAFKEFGVELVIHVDPIDMSSDEILILRTRIKQILKYYHKSSLHELHIYNDEKKVSFHVKLPSIYEELKQKIKDSLTDEVLKTCNKSNLTDYTVEIEFDIV